MTFFDNTKTMNEQLDLIAGAIKLENIGLYRSIVRMIDAGHCGSAKEFLFELADNEMINDEPTNTSDFIEWVAITYL